MIVERDTSRWRVAVVGPVHPYRGGIAHFTEMTVTGLSDRGHDVRPVSFSRQYPELLFPGETQFEPDSDAPRIVRDAPQIIDSINPLSWLRTAKALRDAEPDVVLFQYWMPFFAPAYGTIARLLRWVGIPSFAVVHNAFPHERHIGDVWLSRYFLRACEGHVVMSDAVAENLSHLRHPDATVRQIEHPVYERFGESVPKGEARLTLDLPQDAHVLLFFGFIREYKGLHVLLEALPDVLEKVPDVHLVVAGESYEDPERYRRLLRRYDLGEHVHWYDEYIPSSEVPTVFSAADLVVQPYVSATQSGVAQIATHFEVPMIVTDVGGLAETIPHEEVGFVVPPEDPSALADAIVRYVEEDWYERLVEGVQALKHDQHPDRLYEALEDLFSESTRPRH